MWVEHEWRLHFYYFLIVVSIERKLIYMSITSHRFGFLCSSFIFCHTFHDGMLLLLFTLHSAIYYYYFVGMCFMHGNLIEIYLVAAEMSQSTIFLCTVEFRGKEIFDLTQKLLDQSKCYSIPSELKKEKLHNDWPDEFFSCNIEARVD